MSLPRENAVYENVTPRLSRYVVKDAYTERLERPLRSCVMVTYLSIFAFTAPGYVVSGVVTSIFARNGTHRNGVAARCRGDTTPRVPDRSPAVVKRWKRRVKKIEKSRRPVGFIEKLRRFRFDETTKTFSFIKSESVDDGWRFFFFGFPLSSRPTDDRIN